MNAEQAKTARPLINKDAPYVSTGVRTKKDDLVSFYDAHSKIRYRTLLSETEFERIYRTEMKFFRETESLQYKLYQSGEKKPQDFYEECARRLRKDFPKEMSSSINFNAMMKRIDMAMFHYDVLQPLIDDPDTTDIKVSSYNDIRVRVKGEAYSSNVSFLDEQDLFQFVYGLGIRNGIDILKLPIVTFTDKHDENYILRFTVSAPCINAVDYPYLHIRKVSKKKPDWDELIRRGVLTPDVKAYLIDKTKTARAVVFAGPPGSGKTTGLNAFIEHIPKTRETLVIQENDELFTDQPGFMFKHVSNGFRGEPMCTLETLARMALVEGCNEIVVGEVKGGEMRHVMTLLNSGGYGALTVHANSVYQILPKLADLVKYGSDYSYEDAKKMLESVDVLVYMEGYKIREIVEVDGYDPEAKDYNYIPIYRYGI